MVILVAKQSIDTSDLGKVKGKWKNGTGSVKAKKDGKLWYKITDIQAPTEKKFKKIINDPDKLFKGADTITGSDFGDTLLAYGGDDVVKAGGGADIVEGGAGNDQLFGGGDDDRMSGGDGADLLSGGAGDNLLTGNGGRDSFLFDAPLKPGNQSRITDFEPGVDTIQLDRSVFRDIGGKGKLPADSLFLYPDPSKVIPEHSVIYDKDNGEIWYTENGSIIDAVLFAKVTSGIELSHKDFLIV